MQAYSNNLVLFSIATSGFVSARPFDGPGATLNGTHANALEHVEQMFSSWHNTFGGSPSSALSAMIQSISAKFPVLNYGCYCYLNMDQTKTGQQATFAELPGPKDGFAGAHPVDALDTLCRDLHLYQQCIEMDSANGFYKNPCNLNDGYFYQTHQQTGNNNIACSQEDYLNEGEYNPEQTFRYLFDCKAAVCDGDRDFVNKVADLYESGTFTRTADYFAMVQKGTYANTCGSVGSSTVDTQTSSSNTQSSAQNNPVTEDTPVTNAPTGTPEMTPQPVQPTAEPVVGQTTPNGEVGEEVDEGSFSQGGSFNSGSDFQFGGLGGGNGGSNNFVVPDATDFPGLLPGTVAPSETEGPVVTPSEVPQPQGTMPPAAPETGGTGATATPDTGASNVNTGVSSGESTQPAVLELPVESFCCGEGVARRPITTATHNCCNYNFQPDHSVPVGYNEQILNIGDIC